MISQVLFALAMIALLAAPCDSSAQSASSPPVAATAGWRGHLTAAPSVAVSPESAAERLLDLGESFYSKYFPGRKVTALAEPFRFRYYSETGVYLGVVVKGGMGYTMDGVYVMGGPFGPNPVYVGLVADFIAPCTEGEVDPLSSVPLICHDLDGNGVADTSVTLLNGQLIVRGPLNRDLALDVSPGATLTAVASIGSYSGGPLSELAVRVDEELTDGYRSKLYVIDIESATKPRIAYATQPFSTPTPVYTGFPRSADGRRIPVMVPGVEQSNKTWDYLCRFAPGSSDTGCGEGFSKMDAYPPAVEYFQRHQGAWIQDTDGDGTDDLHLTFYIVKTAGGRQDGGVLTISMATGARTFTRLNLSESSRDGEELFGSSLPPTWASLATRAQGFDGGRLYGTTLCLSAVYPSATLRSLQLHQAPRILGTTLGESRAMSRAMLA
jgi:hypothetical protein